MKRMMMVCWVALTLVAAAGNAMAGRWRASGGWVDKQKTQHTARLEPTHKPIRIRDVNFDYPDSPAYWYRTP